MLQYIILSVGNLVTTFAAAENNAIPTRVLIQSLVSVAVFYEDVDAYIM